MDCKPIAFENIHYCIHTANIYHNIESTSTIVNLYDGWINSGGIDHWMKQARKYELNRSYKPVGIIDGVPVAAGVVVVVGMTNGPGTTAK